jgi:putative transcriptional regulator
VSPDDAPVLRRGRLLVASPALEDPNFARAVVLVLEHSEEGALGVVLNRPTEVPARGSLPEPLALAMHEHELVHRGGPVQPESVIVLADFLDPDDAAQLALRTVGVVDPADAGNGLAHRVRAMRAFGGYAGWSAGQLEGEIEQEAWIDVEAEPEDVFTGDAPGLWSRVLARKGGHFRVIALMPEDPSVN